MANKNNVHLGSKRTSLRFAFLPVTLTSGKKRFFRFYRLVERLELDGQGNHVWVIIRRDPS